MTHSRLFRPARPARLRRLLAGSTLGLLIAGLVAAPAPAALAVGPSACSVSGTAGTFSTLSDAMSAAASGATLTVTGTCATTVTIGKNLTIVGQVLETAIPTLDGGGVGHVLDISSGVTVTLRGLTITGGFGNGAIPASSGGGIRNAGTLTLKNVTVSGNTANGGGGIFNTGTLTLAGATVVRDNNGVGMGGGIFNAGTLTLKDTAAVTDNAATSGTGGGIVIGRLSEGDPQPVVELHDRSSVTLNEAQTGGGITANASSLLITDRAVVANNTASDGGGGLFLNEGLTTVSGNAVIRGNHAAYGGGIATGTKGSARIALKGQSVIKANIAGSVPAIYLAGRLTMSGSATIKGHNQPSALVAVHVDSSADVTVFLRMKDSSRITGNTVQTGGAAVGTFICRGGPRPALDGVKGRVVANTPANTKAFTSAVC